MVTSKDLELIDVKDALAMFHSNDADLKRIGAMALKRLGGAVADDTPSVPDEAPTIPQEVVEAQQNGASEPAPSETPAQPVSRHGKVPCPVCGGHYRAGQGLKIHMSRMHKNAELPENMNGNVAVSANEGREYIALANPERLPQNDTDAAMEFARRYANALGVEAVWRDGTFVWFAFSEKPSKEITDFMKQSGLFFAPRTKRWYYPASKDSQRPRGQIERIV